MADTYLTNEVTARGIVSAAAATRNGLLGGGSSSANKTDGTVAGATYRSQHFTPQGASMSDIVVSFDNWRWGTTGEVVGDNDITVKAYLEYSGVSYPLTLNGAQTVTITPGARVSFDALPITIPANTAFYVRPYVTAAGVVSGTWPLGRFRGPNDYNNYSTGGGDVASSTGAIGAGGSFVTFGPSGIYGTPSTPVLPVGLIADSLGAGVGDTFIFSDTGYYAGFIERALNNRVPWVAAARGSYRASYISSILSRLWQLFAKSQVKSVISEIGVNDLPLGAAATQSAMINVWNMCATRGIKVRQTTLTPYLTTSTNGWTDVANQTASIYNPARITVNAWLRAGAPLVGGSAVAPGTNGALLAGQQGHPLAGYIEVSDTVENSRDDGLWKRSAQARVTADAAITSASTTLTSATANFTSADEGTAVFIAGAGAAGAGLSAQIYRVTSATTATLAVAAGTTVVAATARFGALTGDGTHPTTNGHILMSLPVGDALATMAAEFGYPAP